MFHAVGSSLRPLAKHPGFTGVAVLSLALGIGVNAIIFSLVDSAILRPLPFSDVGRVVRLFAADDRNVKDADRRAFVLLGRLAPDTTLEQAQLEMDALARRLDLAGPSSNQSLRMALVSELDYTGIGDAGDNKALAYLVLLLVLLVLFVACNNVSGLLLARAEARRPEIATRVALGSSRSHLVALFLKESLLLAFLAAASCLVLVYWAQSALPTLLPALPIPLDLGLRLDVRVVAYTFCLAAVAVMLFGLGPALHASRGDLTPLLHRSRSAGTLFRPRQLGRHGLLVLQLTISFVLLALAGGFMHSVRQGLRADFGFDQPDLLLVTVSPGGQGYEEQAARRYYQEVIAGLDSLPQTSAVSLARLTPFSLSGEGATQPVFLPGDELESDREGRRVKFNIVDREFFQVMGTPLLRGRDFDASDHADAPRVVLVSEAAARRFWPDRGPIGQRLNVGDPQADPTEVIGVVRDARYAAPRREPEPYLYFPFAQMHWNTMTLLVDTRGDSAEHTPIVRQEMRRVDARVEPFWVTTLQESIRFALLPERVGAAVVGSLGGLALLLAVTGLFGVVAFSVRQHTHEIGLRMALGASRNRVLAMFLRRGLALAALSLLIGIPTAVATNRALIGVDFYGADPGNPLIYISAAAILAAATLGGSYLPARRAARLDPIEALRAE